jgi:hypothetical protein
MTKNYAIQRYRFSQGFLNYDERIEKKEEVVQIDTVPVETYTAVPDVKPVVESYKATKIDVYA